MCCFRLYKGIMQTVAGSRPPLEPGSGSAWVCLPTPLFLYKDQQCSKLVSFRGTQNGHGCKTIKRLCSYSLSGFTLLSDSGYLSSLKTDSESK